MFNFPPLRMGVLASLMPLREALEADPAILDSPECPYDNETKDLLRKLVTPRVVEKIVERTVEVAKKAGAGPGNRKAKLSADHVDEVEQDAKDLLIELKNLGNGEAHLDTQAKVQIIKTKAALMERLTVMLERVVNVKKTASFVTTVIDIVQDLVEEGKRDEFLRRIKPYTIS